jgi:virulence-associated protein VapD
MFVISFDLVVEAAERHHPRGSRQAYRDIARLLGKHDFQRMQWSAYALNSDDMSRLFEAIEELKAVPWFGQSVANVRVLRTDIGSDFTASIKRGALGIR